MIIHSAGHWMSSLKTEDLSGPSVFLRYINWHGLFQTVMKLKPFNIKLFHNQLFLSQISCSRPCCFTTKMWICVFAIMCTDELCNFLQDLINSFHRASDFFQASSIFKGHKCIYVFFFLNWELYHLYWKHLFYHYRCKLSVNFRKYDIIYRLKRGKKSTYVMFRINFL